MSLRARLLIAIGVIALAALAIADVVTYSALQSFLYQRLDQQLSGAHFGYQNAIEDGRPIPCINPNQSFPTGPGAGAPDGAPSNAFRIEAVQVRTASGALVGGRGCPTYVGRTAYTPAITSPITGFSSDGNGSQVTFFDALPKSFAQVVLQHSEFHSFEYSMAPIAIR